ncbi:MAG: hypothetical protein WDO06_06905 [Actinomycetota bacterium]
MENFGRSTRRKPSELFINSGEALHIATGAVIPQGVDSVVEWERAEIVGDLLHANPRFGSHIRPAGAECKDGDLLVPRGTQITPGIAGLLSAAGHDHISVTRKPRAVIFFLGDELLHSGIPRGGKVRDSIGPQLKTWLTRLGVEVVSESYIPDELNQLISQRMDLVITFIPATRFFESRLLS